MPTQTELLSKLGATSPKVLKIAGAKGTPFGLSCFRRPRGTAGRDAADEPTWRLKLVTDAVRPLLVVSAAGQSQASRRNPYFDPPVAPWSVPLGAQVVCP